MEIIDMCRALLCWWEMSRHWRLHTLLMFFLFCLLFVVVFFFFFGGGRHAAALFFKIPRIFIYWWAQNTNKQIDESWHRDYYVITCSVKIQFRHQYFILLGQNVEVPTNIDLPLNSYFFMDAWKTTDLRSSKKHQGNFFLIEHRSRWLAALSNRKQHS